MENDKGSSSIQWIYIYSTVQMVYTKYTYCVHSET